MESSKRIELLQEQQQQLCELDRQYQTEVRAVERKFLDLCRPLYEKRAEMVADVDNFWLTVLKNSSYMLTLIGKQDVPALKHLTDIRGYYKEADQLVVEFHFSPNEFFENSVLSVTFTEKQKEGHEDFKLETFTGTEINWKKGKDLTVAEKSTKSRRSGKVTTVEAKVSSFFDLFDPEEYDDLRYAYEIGLFVMENIIPRAALYYLGQVDDDSSDESSSDSSDCSSDDE